MLVLSRKIGEVITIGSEVKITVLNYDRGVVRLGIDAPKSIPVHRKEIYDKIIELNQQAARTGFDAFKQAMAFSKLYFPKNEAKEKELPTLFFSRNKLKK
ncbi:MAG: carbon storage regulator CsrA [Ignavibacteria bacterium]|jgi:carbon storage regulator|nr:carbon storage regulator CsrA [Ignavibacteria bacterium]